MSDKLIDALRTLDAKAGKPDWRLMCFEEGPTVCGTDGGNVADFRYMDDGTLAVSLRNALPALIALVSASDQMWEQTVDGDKWDRDYAAARARLLAAITGEKE